MWAVLALSATVLTSTLPILNKQLLRDARPALVAWAINIASLPLLAAGTLLLTQCTVERLPGRVSFSCTAYVPQVDILFIVGLLGSAILNKLSAIFTILWAWLFLDERNLRARLLGAAVMIIGGGLVASW